VSLSILKRPCAAVAAGALLVCATAAWGSAATVAPAAQQAEWCKRLVVRLPNVSAKTCQNSGLAPSGALSQKGFPILTRRVPAGKGAPSHPVRVLLLGGIHGDELTASAVVFHWMQWMQTPEAQQLDWSIVPVVNPDGLLAPKPKRVNANGVDLNRNFPTPGWEQEAPQYWAKATRSDPRRFPGKAPLSEPETRWLYQEMERFRPQVIISVHAPFGVLDFDGPAPAPTKFGRLLINRVGVYPGSLGNYSGRHKNVPVITIELPNALTMPPEAETRRIWRDMLIWIQRNVPEQDLAAGKRAMRR
jgi:protein MpaA